MLAQLLWQAPRLLPVAIVVVALTVLLVFALYVPQARRLRQPWRWGLPMLRLAVGFALAASLVQPAIVQSDSADPGAVVVLMDRSRSMSIVDARTPAQRVALAGALGLLPAGARSRVAPGLREQLDELTRRVDEAAAARADAEYARLSGQGVIVAQKRYEASAKTLAALAADAAQRAPSVAQHADLAAKLLALAPPTSGDDYRTRITAARTALVAAQASVDDSLYARVDVKSVCDNLATLSRAQLAQRATNRATGSVLASVPAGALYGFTFAQDLQPISPGAGAAATQAHVAAWGERSDITGAVRAAADRVKGRSVQAIVVLTDGRQIGGDGGVASALTSVGAPVYAVSVGTPAPVDLAITEVAIAQRQFIGETITARVHVRGTGFIGKAVEVRLDAGGRPQAKTVTFNGTGAVVEFPLKFDAAAAHHVTVSVAPQPGEATVVNNAAERLVVATPDRAPIVLTGASASWDFQLLRSALSRAPWASVEAEVLDATGARWSVAPADIANSSVVILSDVAADHLTPAQWEALYRLVTERGGSLIILAGRNTSAPAFIDSPLLTDLLPFRAGARPTWRVWPGEQPLFRLQPAAGAGDLSLLNLSEDAGSNVERWLEMPAVFQFLPVTELKPNTNALLVERDSGMAALTESRLGLGRVFFLGVNETWRWRSTSVTGAGNAERFWLQLLRYAADEPYAVQNRSLRLDADRFEIQPGQSLRVRAKVMPADQPPPAEPTQTLAVLRDGAQVATVTLTRDAAAAGRYTGTLDNLAAGEYALQLRDTANPLAIASLPIHVEADMASEMRDVSGDDALLRRLAESTHGQMLSLDEWDTLPRRLRDAHQADRQVAEQRLWDSPQLFAFILGCLGIEWAMRKRLGLA
jgi:hypothetical protein